MFERTKSTPSVWGEVMILALYSVISVHVTSTHSSVTGMRWIAGLQMNIMHG
jgi:hypothetical protein